MGLTTVGPADFRVQVPPAGDIDILIHTGSAGGTTADDVAVQVNISVTDCFGTNRAVALANLTSLDTGKGDILTLVNPQNKGTHYNYDVVPNEPILSGSYNGSASCGDVEFFPSPLVDFRLNQFNAVYNSDMKYRETEVGFLDRTPFKTTNVDRIFTVDTNNSGSSTRPQNIKSILSGSAVTASIQDSTYTSVGIKNSRYDGTETSLTEYGISPALSGRVFRGALYDYSTDLNYIRSSSKDGTAPFKEFLQVLDDYYPYAVQSSDIFHVRGSSATDTPNARYIRLSYDATTDGVLSLNTNDDHGELIISGTFRYHDVSTYPNTGVIKQVKAISNFGGFEVGEPIMHGRGVAAGGTGNYSNPAFEFVSFLSSSFTFDSGQFPVEKSFDTRIEFQTGSRNHPEKILGFDIFSQYTSNESDVNKRVGRATRGPDPTGLFKVIGDSIYESKNNQLARLKNKLLLVEETQEIMFINENGKILFNMGNGIS